MKKSFLALSLLVAVLSAFGKEYRYDAVPNDPYKARIYTLDNGLKVYLTTYAGEPRVQTYVVVRVGGKNDPPETTGLSHYLEHIMFKGTSRFGTSDYAKEKPLLDDIERRYEVYRTTTDELQRRAVYHQIDSVSGLAAQYAIANEYDKLMSAIGASGTNAFTSNDATVYQENIPSNQIENWAKIQAERFADPVIRLFHTELETVYEEKNRSLTNDGRKVYEAMLAGLFPHHPYGTQTVLGTQEHLKNPSITNIKKHLEKYYVANNMAVCMSGDFDCDTAIAIVDRYFGTLKKREVEPLQEYRESMIMPMQEKTVYGPEAESIAIGFRFAGAASEDADMLRLLDMALMNGHAGLIDLNITQEQKLLHASSNVVNLTDHQALLLQATPKQGQTLDEAKALLFEQLEKLKNGEFEDWLLKAVITDFRLSTIQGMESNAMRVMLLASSFTDDVAWKDRVERIDRMEKITKQQLVKFANERLGNCYVVVYKRTGKDPDEKKIDKPEITPVQLNRNAESSFLTQIKSTPVKPIEPVFLNFKKDLSKLKIKSGVEALYKQNSENDLFELAYVFDMGANHDKELPLATSYLKYLGTGKYTAAQLKQEFYKQGSSFTVFSSGERVYVSLSGLSSNMLASLELLEHLLAHAQVNEEAYANLVDDMLKSRANAKLNQSTNFSRLYTYGVYGAFSPATNILLEESLKQLKPQALVDKIHELTSYRHRIFYYGPKPDAEVVAVLQSHHRIPKSLKKLPPESTFVEQPTTAGRALFAHYDAKQIYLAMLSKLGAYDKSLVPIVMLYNEYFGGSMNSIVFQELREARGLAYSASSMYSLPSRIDRSAYMSATIGSQTDKMGEVVTVFNSILNDMPESETAFKLAQDGIIQRLRTERITKADVLWAYDAAQKMKLSYDIRYDIFNKVPTMTLDDVKLFQQTHVKNLPYTYCILGDENSVDFEKMKTFGTVEKLTQEQIFGY
ncbi:MAG: insulinase family protein [Prevotellaceae bacterium]|jgi:predicted Zn-dependent peptidase|nr:insulinase family protein [Prevotellaceae bacterium]